jgi:hypothetical protein
MIHAQIWFYDTQTQERFFRQFSPSTLQEVDRFLFRMVDLFPNLHFHARVTVNNRLVSTYLHPRNYQNLYPQYVSGGNVVL